MTNNIGIKRLQKEYGYISNNPVKNIEACPLENDIFKWHYVIKGDIAPYKNGYYHGILIFPLEYPLKPPRIIMLTPNGRFKTNTRLCLSMSDYHPETWNPQWSVETILVGLYSFMLEDDFTEGSIETTYKEKEQFALKSMEHNAKNENFKKLFSHLLNPNNDTVEKKKKKKKKIEKNNKDETKCRYCFDYGGNLVSPCCCKGGNKWVHLTCLQKWQHSTLISQSTHPKYQTDIDSKCNICLKEYTIKPPDRHDMMVGYTGEELATMLDQGYLIISGKQSSEHNEYILNKYKDNMRVISNIIHWTRAVYLIIDVEKSNSLTKNDGIIAVNLTRPIKDITSESVITLDGITVNINYIWKKYYSNMNNVPSLKLMHFIGGPCNPEFALGICFLKNLENVFLDQLGISVIPIIKKENHDIVKGPLSQILQLFTHNRDIFVEPKIYIYWGTAGWSRTQLLGEIARGGWGMCRANLEDISSYSKDIWTNIYNSGSPMFSPDSEFSEKYDISEDN